MDRAVGSDPARALKEGKQKLQKIEYSFTTNITDATKAHSSKIARMMLNNYIQDTGDTESELVIIPLVISYELVKILQIYKTK